MCKTVFVEMLGESPYVKVLDFLITYDSFEYTKNQVARETGVARMTMENIWNDLIEKNIIVCTKKHGRSVLYILNKNNPTVIAMIDFAMKASEISMKSEQIPVKIK